MYNTHVPFSGRHCCLWCLTATEQLRVPPQTLGPVTPRTTESIIADHKHFLEDGGKIKRDKLFNNAVGMPIFPTIPLIQVRKDPEEIIAAKGLSNASIPQAHHWTRYSLRVVVAQDLGHGYGSWSKRD